MRKLIFVFVLFVVNLYSQELDCKITVNADQIAVSNRQIFTTLENALSEFVNKTQWTDLEFQEHEKIKCGMSILLTSGGGNTFAGSIQVQASRPVFNSTYYSPIFNYNDQDFAFRYVEFQPLNYNPNAFESNLISVLSYYVYTIIGMYMDSFELNGGTEYFKTAQNIALYSEQLGGEGWQNDVTKQTRFTFVDQLLASNQATFRKVMYNYHTKGYDTFEKRPKRAKQTVSNAIVSLSSLYRRQPNTFLVRSFMDAKSDEIVSAFKSGPQINVNRLVNTLNEISSTNAKLWKKIK